MADSKNIVLITGANGGIGFELASQLLAGPSNHVLLGSRSVERGEAAVKDLQSRKLPGTVELVQIDVTKEDSVAAATKTIESKHGRLDALVNNAAIAWLPDQSSSDQMVECYRTNVAGPALTVEHLTPLLKKSIGTARVINVSSGAGSVETRLDSSSPFYSLKANHYRASKSALNMISACQTVELGPEGIKVFLYCPGFTVSKLGPGNTIENGAKPTSEGAAPMVGLLSGSRDAEAGKFVKHDGTYWGW